MITPMVTILVLAVVMIWYIWYIFPQTAGLFEDLGIELPTMTAKTLAFSRWMDSNYGYVLVVLVAVVGSGIAFARSQKGTFLIHKYLIKLPVIGALLHKLNIEIFCRVFAVLYSGSGDNISVIKIAGEACGNTYIDHRIKTVTVPLMIAQGTGLVPAMEASGVFYRHGASPFS